MAKLIAESRIKGIYAITDPKLIANNELVEKVQAAINGGISVLQYRNKLADIEQQLQQAQQLQLLCQKYKVTFIINDNVDLAKQIKADGVHLGRDDASINEARQQLGSQAIIGISCYNDLHRAKQKQNEGADYIAFGRFFPSKTKPQAKQAELELITIAKKVLDIPVVAIGGISAENLNQLVELSVDSVAIINDIFSQDNIENHCQKLNTIFNT